jgi:hypothetical protein
MRNRRLGSFLASLTILAAAKGMLDNEVVETKPLCPYPMVAKYAGSGDAANAANFRCSSSAVTEMHR